MRQKINKKFPNPSDRTGESQYYRYFKPYFDLFLPVRPTLPEETHHRLVYVQNSGVEARLKAFTEASQSFPQAFIGFTGVGKSTILQHFFGLTESTPRIVAGTIVIPYTCNPTTSQLTPGQFFAEGIGAVNDMLQREYGLQVDDNAFHAYIVKHRPQALTRYRAFYFETAKDDLRILGANDQFVFQAMLLKYLLEQKPCHSISQVILVLDDIESLEPQSRQPEFIQFAFHGFSCLRRHDREWHVKLLVAERPYTRAHFNSYDWLDQRPDIIIDIGVSMKELFAARLNYATTHRSTNLNQRSNWDESYRLLCSLVERIAYSQGDFLSALNNFDIRKTLASLDHMLSRGTWFELRANDERSGAFQIDGNTIRVKVTEHRILQSLAYGGGNIYHDPEPKGVGLPNILHNSDAWPPVYDIAPLLLLAWFAHTHDESNIAAPSNLKRLETLYESIRLLFKLQEGLADAIKSTYEHMHARGIFDTILDPDDHSAKITVLMPRGHLMWQLLRESSELIEIFRDDLWHDGVFGASPSRAVEIPVRMHDSAAFCDHIIACEKELLKNLVTPESKRRYKYLFGDGCVSRQLLKGIKSSLEREQVSRSDAALSRYSSELDATLQEMERELHA